MAEDRLDVRHGAFLRGLLTAAPLAAVLLLPSGDALEAAHRAGVILLGYRSRVTLSEALLTESIPVLISN